MNEFFIEFLEVLCGKYLIMAMHRLTAVHSVVSSFLDTSVRY